MENDEHVSGLLKATELLSTRAGLQTQELLTPETLVF